jgi:hypothetical protein
LYRQLRTRVCVIFESEPTATLNHPLLQSLDGVNFTNICTICFMLTSGKETTWKTKA